MLHEILIWVYIVNATLLINHETDSAYWHEWKLFNMKGGIEGFLVIHFPLWIIMLYGLVSLVRVGTAGLLISAFCGAAGIFAFTIHTWFIRKGHEEFTTAMSQFILYATLIVSPVQLGLSLYLLTI